VTSLYGTVEASFHSLIHPEGTVLANHEVHILDRAMQPVPTGVPGVLHLGGTALAKGYLNQNSLTSTRFPHWRGQRLFRTTTLARWRRDGTIEFLSEDPGSLRHVRANEVASVLREHEQVADATAAVRRDFEEDQIMVGYLVAGPTGALDLAEIRKGLEDRLPSHLVPDQLVVLDEIPMCPDGQVDWMALPGVDC
jgi:non-ribosomal peptide synthetase component E (peptide arylation enzyme)